MSHAVIIPDDLYAKLAIAAAERGQSVDTFVADFLARELPVSESPAPLDWSKASAEEIIADLKESRVERERPTEIE